MVENVDLYHKAIDHTCRRLGVDISAWVVLPDHLHMLIDSKQINLSKVIKIFKQDFGYLYRQRIGTRGGRIWQLRFWDHVIRNQDDMNRHLDYIHYNPVKHGLVKAAREYKHSSFVYYISRGVYQMDWGDLEELKFEGDFGE